MIDMTYLKLKQRLKQYMRMTVEKGYEERKKIGVCIASREDSFLNLVPSEA
jgi:hypothetical protein